MKSPVDLDAILVKAVASSTYQAMFHDMGLEKRYDGSGFERNNCDVHVVSHIVGNEETCRRPSPIRSRL